ncbi:MAG: S8 family peptidase [Bacteroidota bacterium]
MKNLSTLTLLSFIMLLHVSLSFAQGIPPREEVNLDDVYAQYNLSGENVVVVILDRGIDYRHPDFLDENGNTRLAYVYDMLDPTGSGNPYGVGTIFTRAEIDEALDNNDPPLSTDRGGHGTATTGIIAGDGSGTAGLQFQGVAPNATIISIKVTHDAFPPFGNQQGQTGFFDPSYLPIALQFAHDKITELGLPSVTLMNLGSIGGPTDGTSTVCQAINQFVNQGHPFVCGVGDDGGNDNHASGNITQGQTIELEIDKAESGFLRMDLWYSEDDRFTVSIERPNGTVEGPFPAPAGPNGAVDQNLGDITFFHRGANTEFSGATSNRRQLLMDFTGVSGTYKVILEGAQISDGDFNATLNPSTYFNNNKFLNFVTPGTSINDYASAAGAIVPTDYVVDNTWVDIDGVARGLTGQGDPGELWIGSSSGPTQDGRLGVDFGAPGEVCHAAYAPDTYYENFSFNVLQNSNGLYGIQNAVSAAAPLSVGVIALMLEARPELTPTQVRNILRNTAREDSFTGTVPNTDWGYGKLDALAAIERTLSVEDSALERIRISPNPNNGQISVQLGALYNEITVRIHDISGKMLQQKTHRNTRVIQEEVPFASGVYFVSVTAYGASSTFKIIKN